MVVYNSAKLAALLLAGSASAMYTKNGPVLIINNKNFDKQILKSNHSSIVEFYAPWCGHCKNLQPQYEKAAANLKGLAQVAAIDCDEDSNKALCHEQGVKGFPTLKIFKPNKKSGKPVIEDYNGPRTAKGIVDSVLTSVPDHVKRIADTTLEEFLTTNNETAKAILFSTKGVPSPLYKALAIDFLGSIHFAQVRDKATKAAAEFGVKKFPTLVLLPGGNKDGVVYDGQMQKDPLIKFFGQVAEPNKGTSDIKKAKKASSADSGDAASSPAAPKPVATFDATIPDIQNMEDFAQTCLLPKSKTCILVITPRVAQSLYPIEEANRYLHTVNPNNFPFVQIPRSVLTKKIKELLAIDDDEDGPIAVRAMNSKRGWFIKYEGDTGNAEALRVWTDSIRMGEAKKIKMKQSQDDVPPVIKKEEKKTGKTGKASEEGVTEEIKEKVEDAKEGIKEKVEDVKESVKEKVENVKEDIKEKVEQATSIVKDEL